jgi:heme exporter protein A
MTGHSKSTLSATGLECVRNEVVLFSGLGFNLPAGELLQVEGPNGSGKTSLLRILCGLSQPEEGTVFWNENDIQEYSTEYLQQVSYVGHKNGIKSELTALENLNVAQELLESQNGVSPEKALQRFGVKGYEDILTGKMSSGQRRRVALSRLLFSNANLWVLDEPFTSIDEEGKQLIKKIIETQLEKDGMVIIATHEPIEITNFKMNKIWLKK